MVKEKKFSIKKKEQRFLLIFAAIFAMAALSFMFPQFTWPIPMPIMAGTIFISIWFFFEGLTEVCRGRTEHILFNHGHRSVREKDIIKIPYYDIMRKASDEVTIPLGDMVVSCTGGFDFWGFTMPGSKIDPILIYPSLYHGKEENNYHSYGNMTRYPYKELPGYVKRVLDLYPNRIDGNTPIYYGVTSHFNGSATKENLKIEAKEADLNTELSEKDELIERLYTQLRMKKESEEKQYLIGQQIKPIDRD